MLNNISCRLVDVIKTTLATCDYTNCDKGCIDYLMLVAMECPVVFNNGEYIRLWNTLFDMCNEIEEQDLSLYFDQ